MAARGYDGTSVQAIADAVGVKKASVLYYYPSKDGLHQAVLEQVLSRWNEVLPRIMMATTHDGVERFDAVMAEVAEFFQADPDRARLLVRELLDRPERITSYIADYVRPWVGVVGKYIEAGKKTGEVRSDVDTDVWVLEVVNLILGSWAMSSIVGDLLGEGGRERHLAEFMRMAKTSLFNSTA